MISAEIVAWVSLARSELAGGSASIASSTVDFSSIDPPPSSITPALHRTGLMARGLTLAFRPVEAGLRGGERVSVGHERDEPGAIRAGHVRCRAPDPAAERHCPTRGPAAANGTPPSR